MTLVVSECADLTNNLRVFIQYACCLEKVSYSISNVHVSSPLLIMLLGLLYHTTRVV